MNAMFTYTQKQSWKETAGGREKLSEEGATSTDLKQLKGHIQQVPSLHTALKDGSRGFRLVTDLNLERQLEPGGK